MRPRRAATVRAAISLTALLVPAPVTAHSGPPFPIVVNHTTGPYALSVWTDPDTTDDGSPGGKFWVTLEAVGGGAVGADTRIQLSIRPLDRPGEAQSAIAMRLENDPASHYAELVMDHEGRYRVVVTVDGALGRGDAAADVDATYDLRPAPLLLLLYLLPFLLVAFLWAKLLVRRRRSAPRPTGRPIRYQRTV